VGHKQIVQKHTNMAVQIHTN